MVWVIVLVICALFAALNGDTSGILVIMRIIGFIIFLFVCQSSKGTDNSTMIENYKDISFQSNPNLTGFKAELQENTKTLNQVADEEWNREKEHIVSIVENNYIYLKKEFNIRRSLSIKGCPYDNAVAEAIFKIIKTEFVKGQVCESLGQLQYKLADYVNWFNNHRIYSSIDYMTPVEYKENALEEVV